METSKTKTRRITSTIIFISIYVVLIGAIVFTYNNYKSIDLKLEITNNEVEKLHSTIDQQNGTISSLSNIKNDYLNIENSINETKKDYFELATKADFSARNDDANFKVCYLTFDDGPYLLTDTFLDILENKDVLATFFTRKRLDEDYIPIYQRQKANGHTIGNHTASHDILDGLYDSTDSFVDDILENRQFIFDMLGITTDVMRFPGGSYQTTYMGLNKKEVVDKLDEIGYGYVDWTHATGDGGATLPANQFLHNVIDYTGNKKVIIVLMHDYSNNTAKILGEMIDTLTKQGYIFLPLWHDSPAVIKGSN